MIFAVGVLEHVPSPTLFINEISKHLKPGGMLCFALPTQDVSSYDVFFLDHMHHFGSDHLTYYARKCGFHQVAFLTGYNLMMRFSVYLWEKRDNIKPFEWTGEPGFTTCDETTAIMRTAIEKLNTLLALLQAKGSNVAVLGLNEVFGLFRAYSNLGDYPLACGLDDVPERSVYEQLPFPVVKPELAIQYDIDDVILTLNPIYYDQVIPRLEALGINAHPILP